MERSNHKEIVTLNVYDNGVYDGTLDFPAEWLINHIASKYELTLHEFLSEYTYDDAIEIHLDYKDDISNGKATYVSSKVNIIEN